MIDTDALDEFNAGTERARDAYDREPNSSIGDLTCYRCRTHNHGKCGGTVVVDHRLETCLCQHESHRGRTDG